MDTRITELVAKIETGRHHEWSGRKSWSVRNELRAAVASDELSRGRIARAIESLGRELAARAA